MNIPNLQKPEIVWDFTRRVFVKENVIPKDLCTEIINFGDENVRVGVNKYSQLFQVSFHCCLLPLDHKVHNVLQDTWKEAIENVDTSVNFVEPYELKRYTKDDFFGRHVDNYSSLSTPIDRKLTMSVQLSNNNDYEGGEIVILGQKYKLTQGSVIYFPTYFNHWVEPITNGTRWSLIGWAWGPEWR